MARIDPKLMLRLPPELKERVQGAASHSNQSMNALIVSVLEREFPHPTIDVGDLTAFLSGLAGQAEEDGDESPYLNEINEKMAHAKTPWCVRYDGLGVLTFYPYSDAPSRRDGPPTTSEMPDNLKPRR